MERKAKTMDKKNDDLYRVINRKEQYSRRICILWCGVKESENEGPDTVVTEIFNELFQEKLTDRSHRVRRIEKGK